LNQSNIFYFRGESIANDIKRHRYICFIIKSSVKEDEISKAEINRQIKSQCLHLFNKNCYNMGIRLIRFDGETGIVKCNHTEKDNTIKLLQSIKKISAQNVQVETFGTSGTIKALIRKYMT